MKLNGFYLKNILLTLLLVSICRLSLAQQVEVITIQHRPAETIADQIKALYPENQVHVAGRHQQLTVRADAQFIDEIISLIHRLDTPLHQFIITVSSDQNRNTRNQGWGASGTFNQQNGNIQITTGHKSYQTRTAGNQSITVVEGHAAYVNAGQTRLVRTRQLINGQLVESVETIDMTSGVYVEPRLVGSDQVELRIRTQSNEASKINTREIDTSAIDTVRVVGLGEWVNLGGTSYDTSSHQQGISYSTKQSSVDKQNVMIKVDLLR